MWFRLKDNGKRRVRLVAKVRIEKNYCTAPGFENGSKVCKLCKAVYALKISPLILDECLNKYVVDEVKFKKLKYDSYVYEGMLGKIQIFLLVYVEDMLIMSNLMAEVVNLKCKLQEQFGMTNGGDLKTFLGI